MYTHRAHRAHPQIKVTQPTKAGTGCVHFCYYNLSDGLTQLKGYNCSPGIVDYVVLLTSATVCQGPTMTAVKTADKTLAKRKTDNTEKAIPGTEREGRKKRRGKVSGAGAACFPLISCNSPNHSDRRRAIDGESE